MNKLSLLFWALGGLFLGNILFLIKEEAFQKPQLATTSHLVGQASVIDGDTLEMDGQRIRLWGIDAPEIEQICQQASKQVKCGQISAFILADFLRQRTLSCLQKDIDHYGRIVALCKVNEIDLGQWQIEQGQALSYRKYSGDFYNLAEDQAREAKRGLWASSFIAPWLYRK